LLHLREGKNGGKGKVQLYTTETGLHGYREKGKRRFWKKRGKALRGVEQKSGGGAGGGTFSLSYEATTSGRQDGRIRKMEKLGGRKGGQVWNCLSFGERWTCSVVPELRCKWEGRRESHRRGGKKKGRKKKKLAWMDEGNRLLKGQVVREPEGASLPASTARRKCRHRVLREGEGGENY